LTKRLVEQGTLNDSIVIINVTMLIMILTYENFEKIQNSLR